MREWLEARREYFEIYEKEHNIKKTMSKIGTNSKVSRK